MVYYIIILTILALIGIVFSDTTEDRVTVLLGYLIWIPLIGRVLGWF